MEQKVIMVVGATGGIGEECVKLLENRGGVRSRRKKDRGIAGSER